MTVPNIAQDFGLDERPLTESGAAERFAWRCGEDVRFDHRRQRWLLWRDHRWVPDIDGAIMRLGLTFAREWQSRANNPIAIPDPDRRGAVFKAAIRLERREALASMLKLASDLKPIADAGDDWDTDPWLLGTPNGVVDLRTGGLRAGRRADRITMSVGVPYDRDAWSVLWEQALNAILPDEATRAFLQTAIGYSATGDTRRDCWFLLQGAGRNGKGTLMHPMRRALGDYACELPAAVLDARSRVPAYELASLPGKRFVVSSESGDTIKIHHDRIKQISGGDAITARNIYERSVEFQPVSHLWLAANRRPRVTDDSPAFWTRVMLVHFPISFVGRENRALRPTLEQEPKHLQAILAWIVEGAVRYRQHGLEPPVAVTTATSEYRVECDPISDFLDEVCERDKEAEIGAADLYAHYRQWADRAGLTERERLTATAFGLKIRDRFERRHTRSGSVYVGLARRIATDESENGAL